VVAVSLGLALWCFRRRLIWASLKALWRSASSQLTGIAVIANQLVQALLQARVWQGLDQGLKQQMQALVKPCMFLGMTLTAHTWQMQQVT